MNKPGYGFFSLKNAPVFIAGLILLLVTSGRYIRGESSFSYFITAGEQFIDTAALEPEIIVQPGPGYDGQFFYRYALDPFSKTYDGIQVDHPAYRHQRILYPLLAWITGFGQEENIPFTLVLVNLIAILFTVFMLDQICIIQGRPRYYALFAVVPVGIMMSLGRDLAEPVEVLFISATVYAVMRNSHLLFLIFSLASVLTREASAMLLLPMSLSWLYLDWKALKSLEKPLIRLLKPAVLLFTVYPVLLGWKFFLSEFHDSTQLIEGGNNLTWPFVGIFQGFRYGIAEISGGMDMIEFAVWLMNFGWIVVLVKLAFAGLRKVDLNDRSAVVIASSWITGLVFAVLFSYSIYLDDWSFARVLSGFNLISFLLIIMQKVKVPKLFVFYTFAVFTIMIGRLWLRV